jgi:hypothetical protein
MATSKIACVGSRDISEQVARLLQGIGKEIVARGWELHSGNANGSDYAFATGGSGKPELVHLHLPWASYNAEQVVAGNVLHHHVNEQLVKIAKAAHPAWNYLGQGSKKLLTRNASIVLSSDVVVAFQVSPGKGGTAHSIRVASDLSRPTILAQADSSPESTILHIEAALLSRG